jgi:hypothetical protein
VLSPEEFEKKNPDFLKKGTAPATGGNKNWLVTPDEAKASQDAEAAAQSTLRESLDLAECGIMPMPGMGGQSHTPASISMTASSGPELSGMLADIMKLAGVHQVEPAHLGIEPAHMEPAHDHSDIEVISAEPAPLDGGDETEIMRSMMDRMNGEMDGDEEFGDEEETDEGMYDNSPNSPEPEQAFSANQYAHQENQPGGGDRMDGNMPRAFATMEERLMADWKQFVTEGVAEGRVDQLPTRGADYSKYDTDHLKVLLRPGILHRNEARFKALIRKELQKREQQGQQGVAEGDSGAKYRVKSVGNDVNPATDERCDYYVNPVTDKKVYCKPGQKVSKGDHVNPTTGKVTPKG